MSTDDSNIKDIPANVLHWKQLKNSEFLGSWDLPSDGSNVLVTIEHIRTELVTNPAKPSAAKEAVTTLWFKGRKKRMIMNKKEHPSAIASWHGDNPHNWIGKDIQLYRTTTKAKGEIVECIRVIRNDKARVKKQSEAAAQAAQ